MRSLRAVARGVRLKSLRGGTRPRLTVRSEALFSKWRGV